MKKLFCTIITHDFFPFALALDESISQKNSNYEFFILVIGHLKPSKNLSGRLKFYSLSSIFDEEFEMLAQKYGIESDEFRWSAKSVWMSWILRKENPAALIYFDPDIFVVDNVDFLFDYLETNSFLLTPHWRVSLPHKNMAEYSDYMTSGLYNGGFIGANSNSNSIEILDWWKHACFDHCVKDPSNGFFVDQSHLNLVPILFEGVKIIKHKGCNVAGWNRIENHRSLSEDGKVFIDKSYEVVFIHFSNSTVLSIINGLDPELEDIYFQYKSLVERYGGRLTLKANKQPLRSTILKIIRKIF